jgi:hypothetical protein
LFSVLALEIFSHRVSTNTSVEAVQARRVIAQPRRVNRPCQITSCAKADRDD